MNFFFKCKRKILVIFFVFIFFKFINISWNGTSIKIKDNFLSQCENEWVKLNKNIYFRKRLAFCYPDIKKIKIYFTKHKVYKHKLKFEIMIYDKNYILKTTEVQYPHLDWHKNLPYQHGYLEADFDCLKLINKQRQDSILKINIFSFRHKTKEPINLEIKNYNQYDNLKNGSIICGKFYYFKESLFKSFQWWIETLKLSGYEKIVIVNNSIGKIHNNLLNKHKDFVQIIQYQCIPNLFTNLFSESYFKFIEMDKIFPSLSEADKHGIYLHFEYLSRNECYLLNKEKYKYIAIFDNDEYILPRLNNIFNKLDFTEPNKLIKNHNCYKDSRNNSKLEIYFQDINKNLNSTEKNTLLFLINLQLKGQTMKIVFKELEKILKNYTDIINKNKYFLYSINIKDPNDKDDPEFKKHRTSIKDFGLSYYKQYLDFNLTINSKEDFIYAKYLYDSYKNLVEPFLEKNKFNLKNVEESINRFYFILGDKLSYPVSWKTVHDTLKTTHLNWHFPNNVYETQIKVPNNLGHVSHFRIKYHAVWKNYPITNLFFDFDYFVCYYLKILQKLNYKVEL